jgi:endoglucanase
MTFLSAPRRRRLAAATTTGCLLAAIAGSGPAAVASQHRPLSRHSSPLSRHSSPLSRRSSPLSRHGSPLSRHGSPHPAARWAPQLHVSGNHLVDAAGRRMVLHGVDRSGGEYQCVRGRGIWDGPMNQAAINVMKTWDINAVRVPLNEACWNGQSYVEHRYRGARYRRAVEAYVHLLNRNGLVAILDLHWSNGRFLPKPTGEKPVCDVSEAQCQKPMPDAAQSVPFWTSVARTFRGENAVIFDLFNEPYPNYVDGATWGEAWHCWRYGGTCTGISYRVAGMQTLVRAVRSAGARNVIMVGGISSANDLDGWLTHEPSDPDHNLVASWHSYSFSICVSVTCWVADIAPVIARVPVIVGELGESDCSDAYIDPLMSWLDTTGTSYLAWAWNANFHCTGGPSLISSYSGAPTPYGLGFRAHLRSLP